jgi:hypothetical protein
MIGEPKPFGRASAEEMESGIYKIENRQLR